MRNRGSPGRLEQAHTLSPHARSAGAGWDPQEAFVEVIRFSRTRTDGRNNQPGPRVEPLAGAHFRGRATDPCRS